MLSTIPLDLGLGRGREIFVDIGLADGVLQRIAGRIQRQHVARPLLRRPGQRRFVESEIGVAERLGKHVRLLLSVWKASQSFQFCSGSEPTSAASLGIEAKW